MSLNKDSLTMQKTLDKTEEAPGIEIKSVQHDSLSMFLAALGGATLGVLLTLLILAVINNGTLAFTSNARLEAVEATLSRVNENVGTLSTNLDAMAAEATALRASVQAAQDALRMELATQEASIASFDQELGGIDEALTTLDATRQRFDAFVTALDKALQELDALDSTTGGAAPTSAFEQP
jgi:hypothetical protein